MKKLFSLVTGFLMMTGFFAPSFVMAGVPGQIKDQYFENTTDIGEIVVGPSTWNRAQTFRPTVSKITSVNIYLTQQVAGKRLNVMIKKESDGSIVSGWHSSVPFVGGNGWVGISYDSPFVTVVPETEYGIYLAITENPSQTSWGWKNGNPYTRGGLKGFADNDGLFSVYGIPPTSTPENSADTPTDNTTTQKKTTDSSAVTVDESIKVPVLTKIEKNGEIVTVAKGDRLSIAEDDKVVLYGTTFKGAKVALTIGDKTYTADADNDAEWMVEIVPGDFAAGEYTIKGQAQTTANKGSEIVDLVDVKFIKALAGEAATTEEKVWAKANNWIYALAIIALLLLALIIGLVMHRWQKKGHIKPIHLFGKKPEDRKGFQKKE